MSTKYPSAATSTASLAPRISTSLIERRFYRKARRHEGLKYFCVDSNLKLFVMHFVPSCLPVNLSLERVVYVAAMSATAPQPLPGTKNVVLVMSGKGGVGKSTVATNLALAISRTGRRVGLLDADIYGPSIRTMLGITGRPVSLDGKTIEPLT